MRPCKTADIARGQRAPPERERVPDERHTQKPGGDGRGHVSGDALVDPEDGHRRHGEVQRDRRQPQQAVPVLAIARNERGEGQQQQDDHVGHRGAGLEHQHEGRGGGREHGQGRVPQEVSPGRHAEADRAEERQHHSAGLGRQGAIPNRPLPDQRVPDHRRREPVEHRARTPADDRIAGRQRVPHHSVEQPNDHTQPRCEHLVLDKGAQEERPTQDQEGPAGERRKLLAL